MGGEILECCSVTISSWDTLKIRALSVVLGFWIIIKRTIRWLWKPISFNVETRDTPPLCLVDSTFGQHSYVKLRGVKLHYVESGSRDHPLVVLLHGFPDCWLTWQYQIPALAQHFRVVALDLKGFGDSEKPLSRKKYQVNILLGELKEFITALGVSSCTIVGHDLGALLGWFFVHQFPNMVNKFICVSSPHPNIHWNEIPQSSLFSTRWVVLSQLPYLAEAEAMQNDMNVINRCYSHLQKKTEYDSIIAAYKYTFSRKEDWTGAINYYRTLPFHRVKTDSMTIYIPTLFIAGNKDDNMSLESLIKTTEYTEKFIVKIVEGTGHFPHQEKPEVVNKLMLSFLVVPEAPRLDKSPSKGLMNMMFGAVSSTVKYGNHVIDAVQKKTNGVVNGLPSAKAYFGNSS